jgi:hypothetical protein
MKTSSPSRRMFVLATLCLCFPIGLFSAARAEQQPAERWFRGNTHAHSLWSDGDEFAEMVADWYKSHGYDFLVHSDHDCLARGEKWKRIGLEKDCVPPTVIEKCRRRFGKDWLAIHGPADRREVKLKTFAEYADKLAEPGKFLLIEGEEISDKHGDRAVHINALNLSEAIPPTGGDSLGATIAGNFAAVTRQAMAMNRPILAQLNHPNWKEYDIMPEDVAPIAAVRMFEVCNANPGINHYGDATHPSTEKFWDAANAMRLEKLNLPPLYGVAADDAHHYQTFSPWSNNPGRAWIMVRAKELSVAALFDAIERGDFYATTGVELSELNFDPKQREFRVAVRAVPSVKYTIEFIGTPRGVDPTAEILPPSPKAEHADRTGRKYPPQVGMIFKRVEGTSAVYKMTGKELYVRAAVRSDAPMKNPPAGEIQHQEAWCQPVGWEKK